MSNTISINTIAEAHQIIGLPSPKHPLVSVTKVNDFQNVLGLKNGNIMLNLFLVHFKQVGTGSFNYGRNSYDYKDGTLLFTAPGQVAEFKTDEIFNDYDKEGWKLAFHPDLIRKSELGKKIDRYSFFNYDVNEALHISEKERNILEDILEKIVIEYS